MPLPNLLTSLIPQLADVLIPRIADIFRRDTRDLKAAVDAELATLARTQAELNTTAGRQAEAIDAARAQITAVERKIDLLLGRQDTTDRQLAALQAALTAERSGPPVTLIWASFAVSLLTLGVSVGLLVLRR